MNKKKIDVERITAESPSLVGWGLKLILLAEYFPRFCGFKAHKCLAHTK